MYAPSLHVLLIIIYYYSNRSLKVLYSAIHPALSISFMRVYINDSTYTVRKKVLLNTFWGAGSNVYILHPRVHRF